MGIGLQHIVYWGRLGSTAFISTADLSRLSLGSHTIQHLIYFLQGAMSSQKSLEAGSYGQSGGISQTFGTTVLLKQNTIYKDG